MKLLIPIEDMVFPPDRAILSILEQDPDEPQKVCHSCMTDLLPLQIELQKTMSKSMKDNAVDRADLQRYFNSPLSFSLEQEIKKATYTLLNFTSENILEGKDTLPRDLLWDAHGIAILTFIKAGFFFTGRFGTGLVIGKLPNGNWSAPSAIASTGVGWGFQIGGEVTDVVIILNTPSALESFMSKAQVSLGTELSVSVGPLGRSAGTDVRAGDQGMTAAFSYAHSKGLFVGVSLEAAVLCARDDVNEAFYGIRISPKELLTGQHPPPPAAQPLYRALSEVVQDANIATYFEESHDPTINKQIEEDRNLAIALQRQEFEQQAQVDNSQRENRIRARHQSEDHVQNQGSVAPSLNLMGTLTDAFQDTFQVSTKTGDAWAAERDQRLKLSQSQNDNFLTGDQCELKEMAGRKPIPQSYSLYCTEDDF